MPQKDMTFHENGKDCIVQNSMCSVHQMTLYCKCIGYADSGGRRSGDIDVISMALDDITQYVDARLLYFSVINNFKIWAVNT